MLGLEKDGKRAVIVMGHGSRAPHAGESMERVADGLRQSGDYHCVEICYMELTGPYLPEAMETCINAGASEVILIPYFLHMGLHPRVDIPRLLKDEAAKYPAVQMMFGKHLGYDDLMVKLVTKRIDESTSLADIRGVAEDSEAAKIRKDGCHHHHAH